MSRTAGSKNFNRKLLQEAFAEKDFNLVDEWIRLFQDADSTRQVNMVMHAMEFVFPKRRPEDGAGVPGETNIAALIATDEQLAKLVLIARGQK